MRHEKSENIQVNASVSRSHEITYIYMYIYSHSEYIYSLLTTCNDAHDTRFFSIITRDSVMAYE